jgi:hypothetical protein
MRRQTTSGLRLELSGDPAPILRLDALIDDRGMALGESGSSSTLANWKRVLVRVHAASGSRTGRWDAQWHSGRYGDLDRQLKGGWLGARGRHWAG